MAQLARTSTGDLAFPFAVVTDQATCVVIRLQDRLQLWQGEWYLNTLIGVPYRRVVFAHKNPDLRAVEQMLRQVITTTEGVADITQFTLSLDRANRRLNYTFTALTDTGATITGGSGQPFIVNA